MRPWRPPLATAPCALPLLRPWFGVGPKSRYLGPRVFVLLIIFMKGTPPSCRAYPDLDYPIFFNQRHHFPIPAKLAFYDDRNVWRILNHFSKDFFSPPTLIVFWTSLQFLSFFFVLQFLSFSLPFRDLVALTLSLRPPAVGKTRWRILLSTIVCQNLLCTNRKKDSSKSLYWSSLIQESESLNQ